MLRRFEAMEDASAYAGCLSTFVALQQKRTTGVLFVFALFSASLLSAKSRKTGGRAKKKEKKKKM
jgi:hypothetical protein